MRAHTIVTVLALFAAAVYVYFKTNEQIFASRELPAAEIVEFDMQRIDDAIQLYRLQHRKVPDSLFELTQTDEEGESFLYEITDDPWGFPYVYRPDGRGRFRLRSSGPDGELDTDDDIVHETGR